MATKVPPARGEAFAFTIPGLKDQANVNVFKVNPTLAAGDVLVYKDGLLDGNIDTLPTAIGAGAPLRVSLSNTEMEADDLMVLFHDVAGAEWQDVGHIIFPSANRIDDLATDVDVWAYATRTLTQAAATVAAVVADDDITAVRGDSFSASLTGLGDISTRTKLWFTVKADKSDADTASIIQIEETAGLVYFNGAVAAVSANGTITVTDQVAGDLTIAIDEEEMANLAPTPGLYYDIQMLTAAGTVTTLTNGLFATDADVTRAIA